MLNQQVLVTHRHKVEPLQALVFPMLHLKEELQLVQELEMHNLQVVQQQELESQIHNQLEVQQQALE